MPEPLSLLELTKYFETVCAVGYGSRSNWNTAEINSTSCENLFCKKNELFGDYWIYRRQRNHMIQEDFSWLRWSMSRRELFVAFAEIYRVFTSTVSKLTAARNFFDLVFVNSQPLCLHNHSIIFYPTKQIVGKKFRAIRLSVKNVKNSFALLSSSTMATARSSE